MLSGLNFALTQNIKNLLKSGEDDLNQYVKGLENLIGFGTRLSGTKNGFGIDTNILCIAQSFGADAQTIFNSFANTMYSRFGNGGDGFMPVAYYNGTTKSNGMRTGFDITQSAGWSNVYLSGTNAPSLSHAVSSIAGSKITITAPANSAPLTSIRVWSIGHSASAVFKVRINGGAYSGDATITAGTGVVRRNSITITGTGAYVLELEVVSGTCQIAGIELISTQNGVYMHNLSASGSRADHWIAPSASQFDSTIKNFAPDFIEIILGGNDASLLTGVNVAQFIINLRTLLIRLINAMLYDFGTTNPWASRKRCDICFVIVPQNGRIKYNPNNPAHVADYGNGTGPGADNYNHDDLVAYANAADAVCAELKCAFLNMQALFPLPFSNYASGSLLNLYNPDQRHLLSSRGGSDVADWLSDVFSSLPFLIGYK